MFPACHKVDKFYGGSTLTKTGFPIKTFGNDSLVQSDRSDTYFFIN